MAGIGIGIIPDQHLAGDAAPFLEVLICFPVVRMIPIVSKIIINRRKHRHEVIRETDIFRRLLSLPLPVNQSRDIFAGIFFCGDRTEFHEEIKQRTADGAVFLFESKTVRAPAETVWRVIGADVEGIHVRIPFHILQNAFRQQFAQTGIAHAVLTSRLPFSFAVHGEIFRMLLPQILFRIFFPYPAVSRSLAVDGNIHRQGVSQRIQRLKIIRSGLNAPLLEVRRNSIVLTVAVQKINGMRVIEKPVQSSAADLKIKFGPAVQILNLQFSGLRDFHAAAGVKETNAELFLQKIINGITRSVQTFSEKEKICSARHDTMFLIRQRIHLKISRGNSQINALSCRLNRLFHRAEIRTGRRFQMCLQFPDYQRIAGFQLIRNHDTVIGFSLIRQNQSFRLHRHRQQSCRHP